MDDDATLPFQKLDCYRIASDRVDRRRETRGASLLLGAGAPVH